MKGCAAFLCLLAQEPRVHMLYDYLANCNAQADPLLLNHRFMSLRFYKKACKAEKRVTAAIVKLVELCYEESDNLTINFFQCYLTVQHEEVAQAKSILDRIRTHRRRSASTLTSMV